MTQVSLAEIPQVPGPAFAAGDAAAEARAQERANVEQIGRMVYAISRGRFDELREQLAPDVACEMVAPARIPWRRHACGADDGRLAGFRSVVGDVGEPGGD